MATAQTALLEAARILGEGGLTGDMELYLDDEGAARLLDDEAFQNALLHPSRSPMSDRRGFASIGSLRVRDICIRVYQKLT
jgi:hypothetical protein